MSARANATSFSGTPIAGSEALTLTSCPLSHTRRAWRRAGVLGPDEELAHWLSRHVPPERVLLVANKAEGARAQARMEQTVADCFRLGFGDPVAMSAATGEGVADLYVALRPHVDRLVEEQLRRRAEEEAGGSTALQGVEEGQAEWQRRWERRGGQRMAGEQAAVQGVQQGGDEEEEGEQRDEEEEAAEEEEGGSGRRRRRLVARRRARGALITGGRAAMLVGAERGQEDEEEEEQGVQQDSGAGDAPAAAEAAQGQQEQQQPAEPSAVRLAIVGLPNVVS